MDGIQNQIIRAELARIGLRWTNCVSWNDATETLFNEAVERGEGQVTASGALAVTTGEHTGRSPDDKFIVRDEMTEHSVWWDNNRAISRSKFDTLRTDMMAHARLKSLFVQDLVAGADADHQLPTRVVTELAWHALFMRHLLRQPVAPGTFAPQLTIINLPSFKADPVRHGTRSETVIAVDLKNRLVLIGGTKYAGETKKAVFTVMNYLLPQQGVLSMHCSANVGEYGDAAIFFGLSGTGKTTLSTDPDRALLGDDEHGWSPSGIFNIEGGCYAKVINLSEENEPEIHAASLAKATVLENIVLDPVTRKPDFADTLLTENTRAAYPLSAIRNADATGCADTPKTIIMLTADAFGVLPPIAKLSPEAAMQHFLCGYTAKVAGTERGVTEPKATFSACFGAPFLPRHPSVYANLLRDLIETHNVPVYLVNTGWTGGGYGVGRRMPIKMTRALVNAALRGALAKGGWRTDKNFGFAVPVTVDGVPAEMLDPRQGWSDKPAYDAAANKLVRLFETTIAKFDTPEPPRMIAAQ
jgi:phosphoenolpyruvate carboxykinase (ATP)